MKTKLPFCVCLFLILSFRIFAQTTWDSKHSYSYDAKSSVLSNVVLILDVGEAGTPGFDYSLRLLNEAGTTYYTIFDQPSQGGIGGAGQGQAPYQLTVPTVNLDTVKGLPNGNYILLGHASIVQTDVPLNTSLNYIVYSGASAIEPESNNLTENILNVYPNPAKSVSNFSFDLSVPGGVSLNIYDVNGKLVSNLVQDKMLAGNHIIPLDMSTWKSGMYFYRFAVDDQVMSGMLVKE